MSRLSINATNNLLVLDWDGTLAASDTLSLISPSPEALEPYTKAYMHDMKKLSDSFGARDSLPKMTQWLGAMQEIEYASVERVEQGGLFKGALRQDLLSRANDQSKLQLQQGASDLLKAYRGKWGIVSVGWSGIFIQAALESRGVDMSRKHVGVSANEVCFDDQGVGTGLISKHEGNDRGIRTAQDKQREMRIMVKRWKEGPESDGRIIYIGDSETDLLCLLEADMGIIMNSPGMVEKCRKLGLQVVDGLQKHDDADKGRSLYYVEDFRALLDE